MVWIIFWRKPRKGKVFFRRNQWSRKSRCIKLVDIWAWTFACKYVIKAFYQYQQVVFLFIFFDIVWPSHNHLHVMVNQNHHSPNINSSLKGVPYYYVIICNGWGGGWKLGHRSHHEVGWLECTDKWHIYFTSLSPPGPKFHLSKSYFDTALIYLVLGLLKYRMHPFATLAYLF